MTDPQKAPIAGATVCATFSSNRLSTAETRDPVCAATDSSGAYRLADLLPARYEVAASAPRHVPAQYRGPPPERQTFFELEQGRTERVDLVLEPGGVEVRGHVKDISGGVIRGAAVRVGAGRWGTLDDGFALARTDAAGAFSAWVAEGYVTARASAEGYAGGWKSGNAPGPDLEILLTPESVLVGRVVEAGGEEPVPGARISLDGEGGSGGWVGNAAAITDEEGRFTVRRLAPGRYKPTATAPGRYGQARESVLLGLGETSKEVVVEVHPAFDVSGKVVVAPEGSPCVDGVVELEDRVQKQHRWRRLEKDGTVRFEGVLPGRYDVQVRCEGRVPEPRYPAVVVASADVTGLAWTVRAGLELQGRLVDRDDKPVAGRVRATPKNADPKAQRINGYADVERDGRFSLKGLLAGKHTVRATPTDRPEPEPLEVELREGAAAEIKIVVESGGGIEGTVADEQGRPVAGADVTASGPKYAWNRAQTQTDGSFVFKGLAPGAYRLEAEREGNDLRAPGKKDDDMQGQPVTVKAGAVARARLVVERADGEISGHVVDDLGGPVTDAFLEAERESDSAAAAPGSAMRRVRWASWSRSPALTDVAGKFTLGGLSKGTYAVHAYRKGGGETFAEHVRLGDDVTLTIRPGGSLSGTVTIEGGGTPDRITLRLSDKKSGFSRAEGFFRTGGAWVMNDLPAGTFEVSVDAAEGTAVTEVPLAEGEQKSGVALSLSGRVTLKGRAVSMDGAAPVPGMQVYVASRKGGGASAYGQDPDKNNVTGADGSFSVEHAPSGSVLVVLMPLDWQNNDYGYAQIPVETGSGPVADVGDLVVPRRRLGARDRGGDLGFTLQERTPGTDPTQVTFTVAVVRPDGPAAAAGMTVGDVIVSVDGHDVTGERSYLYNALARVAEGTAVTFGLERGGVVSITAAKPL